MNTLFTMCSLYEQQIKSEPEESERESVVSDQAPELLDDGTDLLYRFYTASKRDWDQYIWSKYIYYIL